MIEEFIPGMARWMEEMREFNTLLTRRANELWLAMRPHKFFQMSWRPSTYQSKGGPDIVSSAPVPYIPDFMRVRHANVHLILLHACNDIIVCGEELGVTRDISIVPVVEPHWVWWYWFASHHGGISVFDAVGEDIQVGLPKDYRAAEVKGALEVFLEECSQREMPHDLGKFFNIFLAEACAVLASRRVAIPVGNPLLFRSSDWLPIWEAHQERCKESGSDPLVWDDVAALPIKVPVSRGK